MPRCRHRQSGEEEDAAAEGEGYQLEMMRCLREINVDNNMVGWYQSTYSGSFQVRRGAGATRGRRARRRGAASRGTHGCLCAPADSLPWRPPRWWS